MEPCRVGRTRLLMLLAATAWSVASYAADWSTLARYQQTISCADFETLLTHVYCPSGALSNYLSFTSNSVTVFSTPEKTNTLFTLRFADKSSSLTPHPSSFHRIALDPGHIGGEWARMEERYFERGKDRPVEEAVLNLTVARLLKARLETAGGEGFFPKNNPQPAPKKKSQDVPPQAQTEGWLLLP